MFKKVFFVFVAILIFLSVPVYADDEYIIQPGSLFQITFDAECRYADVEFSDNVLYFASRSPIDYTMEYYNNFGTNFAGDTIERKYLMVLNINDSPITFTLNDGSIYRTFQYSTHVFTVVPFDGSRTPFEFTNIHVYEHDIKYKVLNYNNGSLELDPILYTINFGETLTFDEKGVLLLNLSKSSHETDYTFEGVYEVGDFVRSDFFQKPPYLLTMDLNGILGACLENLPKLLLVGLVVLSVFLAINLARYMIRLFL